MFNYYKFLLFILISASPFIAKAQNDTLAFWTFESRSGQSLISPPNAYGPITPEQGNGNLISLHQNGAYAATFANAGNGTGKSLNLNRWTTIGDYIQFQVNTTGKSNIQLDFEQGSASGNGPLDFKVSYSTDGTTFTDLPAGSFQQTASVNGDWTATTYLSGFHKSFTLPAAINNAASAYIRIATTSLNSVSPGTQVAPAGNSRFDNILITGTTIIPTTQITNVASSDSSFCNSGANTFLVSFNTSATATTTYTVERSDASGSFAAPVAIGSGTASPITATVPAGITAGNNYRIRVVAAGSVSLNTAGPVVIDPAVSITVQPSGFTVCEGAIVNLEMQSANAQSYQWLHNGLPVVNNSFSNSFNLPAALLSEAGTYRVALTNGACADTSNGAVVVINPGTIPVNTTVSGSRFFGSGSNFPVIANNGSCGRLASIKALSNILGNTTVTVTAGAPQQAGANGPWHIGRYYTLNAATAPTGNVAVTFYFSTLDLDAYNLAAPVAQHITANQTAQTLGNFYFSKLTNVNDLGTSNAVLLTPDSVSFQNGYWKVSLTTNSFNSLSTFYAHGSNFQPCPTPTISITESANNICSGTSVNYTATVTSQGNNPVYQWRVNGTNAATGSTYSYTPANGDTVTCILTNTDCFTQTADTSNAIIMHVTPTVTATITISSSNPTSCAGAQVTYSATANNGGATPVYQWKVNGNNMGNGGVTFDYTPNDGDIITCELTSNAACLTSTAPVLSNAVTADVEALVTAAVNVTATPAGNAPQGSPVVYTAAVSGTNVYNLDWYVNNQLVQQQSPNNTYTRNAAAIPDTVYAVLHVEGCFTFPTYRSNLVLVTSTNSIPGVAMDLGLSVYPNPVQNRLAVEIQKGELKEIQLMNILGQTLQTEQAASSKKQVVNFAHLASGVYYVKVRVQYKGEDYVMIEKVIKE